VDLPAVQRAAERGAQPQLSRRELAGAVHGQARGAPEAAQHVVAAHLGGEALADLLQDPVGGGGAVDRGRGGRRSARRRAPPQRAKPRSAEALPPRPDREPSPPCSRPCLRRHPYRTVIGR
jgi:hypothetical protein